MVITFDCMYMGMMIDSVKDFQYDPASKVSIITLNSGTKRKLSQVTNVKVISE